MNSKLSSLCLLLVCFLSAIIFQSVAIAQTAATVEATVQTDDAKKNPIKTDASRLGSLLRIPDTAGIYMSTMNHKAIVESIFESNAYKSIKASEVAKAMKKAYRRGRSRGYEPYNEDNPFAQYLDGYGQSIDSVIFQSIWQIAGQVVDNELFLYIDNDMIPIAESIQDLQLKMIEQFGPDMEELSEEQAAEMVKMAVNEIESLEFPTVMIGSRLDDPEGFRELLDLARSFAEQGIDSLPPDMEFLRKFWKVADEEDHFLMMAEIEMSEMPWDRITEEIPMTEEDQERFEAIRDALSEKTAVVAVGVIDNMLVMGVARDRERLIGFGGEGKLIDLEAMQPLRKAIDENQKLISVFYISQKYAEASYSFQNSWDQIKPMIGPIISEMDEIPEDEREALSRRIETDANEFVNDFSDLFPPMTMTLGITSLHSDGVHSYARTNSKHPLLDGSKPLKMPADLGPETIMFVSQRLNQLDEQYDLASKWTAKFYSYGRDYLLHQEKEKMANAAAGVGKEGAADVAEATEEAVDPFEEPTGDPFGKDDDEEENGDIIEIKIAVDDEPDLKTVLAFFVELEKIARRFDVVTKETLLPAIEGQEACLVVDAVTGPNPWQADIPKSEEPLPLPLPALLVEHSDSSAIVEAGEEYWKLVEALAASSKKHFPEEGEDVNLIPPVRTEQDGEVSFRWTLLHDMANVDASVQPGTMIGEKRFVIGMHGEQATRLATAKNGRVLFGPADTDKPSISLAFYDHPAAMDMLEKWIEFGYQEGKANGEVSIDMAETFPAERDTLQFSEEQLRDAYDRVWTFGKCMKGFSIRSYEDADGTVTESLIKFEDIPATK